MTLNRNRRTDDDEEVEEEEYEVNYITFRLMKHTTEMMGYLLLCLDDDVKMWSMYAVRHGDD